MQRLGNKADHSLKCQPPHSKRYHCRTEKQEVVISMQFRLVQVGYQSSNVKSVDLELCHYWSVQPEPLLKWEYLVTGPFILWQQQYSLWSTLAKNNWIFLKNMDSDKNSYELWCNHYNSLFFTKMPHFSLFHTHTHSFPHHFCWLTCFDPKQARNLTPHGGSDSHVFLFSNVRSDFISKA